MYVCVCLGSLMCACVYVLGSVMCACANICVL